MFSITWQSVLLGVGVGTLCLLGLAWGLKILLDNAPGSEINPSEELPKGKLALGGIVLAGQLVVALVILYFTRNMPGAPLGTGLGVLFTILIGSFFLRNIRGKK